mmetsp:Transcript_16957/g.49140  ORF Transcript_16957/g.49140 Transcript_16957/m.49140 type:complete len:243 (+) Transcript_16957:244-972(+)
MHSPSKPTLMRLATTVLARKIGLQQPRFWRCRTPSTSLCVICLRATRAQASPLRDPRHLLPHGVVHARKDRGSRLRARRWRLAGDDSEPIQWRRRDEVINEDPCPRSRGARGGCRRGTDGRRDHPDHTAGLQGRGAEQASGRGAEKTLCRGSGPARHHNTPQVSMVLATVSSASREAVWSHRSDRTSTHDGRVAVDLLAPRSRRRYHVVSCELYTERGSVPRRTGTIKPRSPSSWKDTKLSS